MTRMKRLRVAAAAFLAAITCSIATAPQASAAPCGGTYTIVVGGFNDSGASVFTGKVDERVVYSAQLSGVSAREG